MAGKFRSNYYPSDLILKHLLAALGIFILGACGAVGQGQDAVEKSLIHSLVARDFLFVATQIFPPVDTTIQWREPDSAFGVELEKGLREIGYGVQRIKSDQGQFFISYNESSRSSSSGRTTLTYGMYIGEVGLERDYVSVSGAGIAPLGPMKLSGTNRPVNLSNKLFPGQSQQVEYTGSSGVEIDMSAITILDEEIMAAVIALRTPPVQSNSSPDLQNQEIEDLFVHDSSNIGEVDRDYKTVQKAIIVFPNDSLSLLEKGRLQISKLVDYYQPETDVFLLVGCSNGPTNFNGGNVSLALGRSDRIAKELLSRKVKEAAIFDEGCWAAESTDKFPSRGVVIELQRRNI